MRRFLWLMAMVDWRPECRDFLELVEALFFVLLDRRAPLDPFYGSPESGPSSSGCARRES